LQQHKVAKRSALRLDIKRSRIGERDVLAAQATKKGETMAEFTVNPQRIDPYKNFRFRVKWDGKFIPGVSCISGLFWTTQVVTYREGGSHNQFISAPGITAFEPITLSRGITHDPAFEEWAALVWTFGGNGVALNELRKVVTITLLNEAGQAVKAFNLHRCWPSRYQPLGSLDSNNTLVALESITLQYEGFERDPAVVEPKQP
jgi:phage tail-like protein